MGVLLREPSLAVVLGLTALAVTACGTSGRAPGDPDAKTLTSIAGAMKAQGHDAEAGVARSTDARLTLVPAGLGGRWRIYQVDGNRPHPVQYTVGVRPGQVVLLTGNGPAFGLMAQAAGVRLTGTAQAVALARVYLRATRSTSVLSYTVDDVRQIRFRPGLSRADVARRDAIVRKYRSVIAPPRGRPDPAGYTVTAYTVRDRELRRRTLEITRTGSVRYRARTLVPDMPVPYTM